MAQSSGETTIEPTHEALLRQWDTLQGWLKEDTALLSVLDAVKRASRDWEAKHRARAWLAHSGERLKAAHDLAMRPDLAASLEAADKEYLSACRVAETAALKAGGRRRAAIITLLLGIIVGLIGWINQAILREYYDWYALALPYKEQHVSRFVLKDSDELALNVGQSFRECEKNCPEMIVLPLGRFEMGSPGDEAGRLPGEGPRQPVSLPARFAVAATTVTFDEWDACVSVGSCPNLSDSGFGRGTRPVINVTWNEAMKYVEWLRAMTGKPYRLLSEAEWEYAARAGTATAYFWGKDIGNGNANCSGCGSQWDTQQSAPVKSFKPNAFGLYDMAGNVWQWVQDCYNETLLGLPPDGTPRTDGDCTRHAIRGGSWLFSPVHARSAFRLRSTTLNRSNNLGFRVARTLIQPSQ